MLGSYEYLYKRRAAAARLCNSTRAALTMPLDGATAATVYCVYTVTFHSLYILYCVHTVCVLYILCTLWNCTVYICLLDYCALMCKCINTVKYIHPLFNVYKGLKLLPSAHPLITLGVAHCVTMMIQ